MFAFHTWSQMVTSLGMEQNNWKTRTSYQKIQPVYRADMNTFMMLEKGYFIVVGFCDPFCLELARQEILDG